MGQRELRQVQSSSHLEMARTKGDQKRAVYWIRFIRTQTRFTERRCITEEDPTEVGRESARESPYSTVFPIVGKGEWNDELDLKCLFVPDIQVQSLPTPEKKPPTPMTGLSTVLHEVMDRCAALYRVV